jgi:small-conductance mechanosensitive channel
MTDEEYNERVEKQKHRHKVITISIISAVVIIGLCSLGIVIALQHLTINAFCKLIEFIDDIFKFLRNE